MQEDVLKDLVRMLRVQVFTLLEELGSKCTGPGELRLSTRLFLVWESEISQRPAITIIKNHVPIWPDDSLELDEIRWKNEAFENADELKTVGFSLDACAERLEELESKSPLTAADKKDKKTLSKKIGELKETAMELMKAKEDVDIRLKVPTNLSAFLESFLTVGAS